MSMHTERASKKQQELLAFVDGFIKGNGYGPSYREVMRALGYKSVSTVATHIDGLIAKGYLRRRDNSARSLEVVTLREPVPSESNKDVEAELSRRINVSQLNIEQKSVVVSALELLGFDELAGKLKENSAKADDASPES